MGIDAATKREIALLDTLTTVLDSQGHVQKVESAGAEPAWMVGVEQAAGTDLSHIRDVATHYDVLADSSFYSLGDFRSAASDPQVKQDFTRWHNALVGQVAGEMTQMGFGGPNGMQDPIRVRPRQGVYEFSGTIQGTPFTVRVDSAEPKMATGLLNRLGEIAAFMGTEAAGGVEGIRFDTAQPTVKFQMPSGVIDIPPRQLADGRSFQSALKAYGDNIGANPVVEVMSNGEVWVNTTDASGASVSHVIPVPLNGTQIAQLAPAARVPHLRRTIGDDTLPLSERAIAMGQLAGLSQEGVSDATIIDALMVGLNYDDPTSPQQSHNFNVDAIQALGAVVGSERAATILAGIAKNSPKIHYATTAIASLGALYGGSANGSAVRSRIEQDLGAMYDGFQDPTRMTQTFACLRGVDSETYDRRVAKLTQSFKAVYGS